MPDRICIFAGTTEGRQLADLLKNAVELTVCVATEYGEIMLDGIEGINVHTGRMEENEMSAFFSRGGFNTVIDATHPYAQIVSAYILSAAAECGIPVMRILREADKKVENVVYVDSVTQARDYLSERDGNILITTGSKELSMYKGLDMSRVWARVLPVATSLEACAEAGIHVSHIIAVQGPFSEESNIAQIHAADARFLVTKESGRSGGFEEKISAAKKTGATAVIIGQPPQGEGILFEDAVAELKKRYSVSDGKIYLIGIGPGSNRELTAEATEILNGCDVVIGARSVVEAVGTVKPTFFEFDPEKIKSFIEAHPSYRRAAVVMRGDIGFYSGAKRIIEKFGEENVCVIPGVSSVAAFAAKIGVSWDDAALISLHGRESNLIYTVGANRKTFALTGGSNTVGAICAKLCQYGFGDITVTVGEKLSYPDEKITRGNAEMFKNREFDSLSVIYIENGNAKKRFRCGIPDDEFIRGEVPMTKSEVRAITLSMLSLSSDSVVWDIGAGTGSVSVECALSAYEGRVYAVEKEHDAAELILINKLEFRADNIEVVEGRAPEVLDSLPSPTHVFIGGSSGNLSEILSEVIKKNPDARIVVNTVTLESQAEVTLCAESLGLEIKDAVCVQVSRARKAGKYRLMNAMNPVFVFTLQGGKSGD